ncbi:hypothetical protein QQX98_004724 [Neonectria punicea]|uniref:Bacteriophage T5 Orf172 DNA-binding domain-containing protein n=1 Tax=Neonectria punicea TaxID=979145 RepID=A0ABR1H8B5_9HYPO
MATNKTPSQHPVLEKLFAIHSRMAICLDSENPLFGKCPEWAKVSNAPCSLRPHQPARATALLDDFNLMKEWLDTAEFLARIETFLIASHCHKHGPRVTKAFREWKANLVVTVAPTAYQPPTLSIDGNEGARKSLDGVPTTPSSSTGLGETKQPESASEVNHRLDNIHVESVTDEFSAMTITTSSHTNAACNPDDAHTTTAQKIIGVGVASLVRKGSLRDHAPVFSEIYKPLTAIQKEHGIVYVLGHKTEEGLFKIGWTRTTARKRLNQAGNCYGANAEIIHETRDGPFFAAHKAEKLAQTVLRHHNLAIVECEQCGGGHREWFRASREMVIDTVEVMETFVRIPAYESNDGDVWKLSAAAYKNIKSMCDFSSAKLRSHITTRETCSIDEATGDFSTQIEQKTVVSVKEAAVSPTSPGFEDKLDGENTLAPAEESAVGKDKKRPRRSLGTGAAIGVRKMAQETGKVVQEAGKIKSRVGQMWTRSRGGIPEPDGDKNKGNLGSRDRSGSGSDNLRDAVTDVFWSLFPEEVKARKGNDANTSGLRRGISWAQAVKQEFRDIVTDFEVEWKREKEELKEASANKVTI